MLLLLQRLQRRTRQPYDGPTPKTEILLAEIRSVAGTRTSTEHEAGKVTAWPGFRSCYRCCRRRQAQSRPLWRCAPAIATCDVAAGHQGGCDRDEVEGIARNRSFACQTIAAVRSLEGAVVSDREVGLTFDSLPPTSGERFQGRTGAPRECRKRHAGNQRGNNQQTASSATDTCRHASLRDLPDGRIIPPLRVAFGLVASGSRCFGGDGGRFDASPVNGPPLGCALREVRVTRALAGPAVDKFAQDVRVPKVMGCFHAHVHEDLVQCHVLRSSGHEAPRPARRGRVHRWWRRCARPRAGAAP